MKTPLLFAALCAATFALAQAEPGAFAPIDETTAEIAAQESATAKIQAFLDAKEWDEGDNAKSDGSRFVVAVGKGTIAAPPNHPSYNVSRSRAFAKAMLAAKAQMANYMAQDIALAVEMSYGEQGAGGDPTPQEQMAAALNAMPDDSLIGKGKRYLHAKMDNLLAKEGVDTSAQREKAQADYAAAAAKAKQLASTESFKRSIGSVATTYIAGLQAFYTVEAQGEIGVVCVWSPALAEVSAALRTGKVPTVLRKGKKPIREQIPSDTRVLLSTFGVTQKIDENGQLVLVSYGQSAARTSSKRSESAAYDKAQLEASAQIRSFAGEAVMTNQALDETEQSLDYDIEGQLPDYRDESSYTQYQASVAKAMRINGIKVIKRWSAKHSVSGKPVYGVVCAWSPSGAVTARQIKATVEASAKAGAEGQRSVAAPAAAGQGGVAPAVQGNKAAGGSSFVNSGAEGDEDAF